MILGLRAMIPRWNLGSTVINAEFKLKLGLESPDSMITVITLSDDVPDHRGPDRSDPFGKSCPHGT